MIADRIGDTVETTLKTYSHLYPDKQSQLVNQLDEINNSTKLVPEHPIEKKKPWLNQGFLVQIIHQRMVIKPFDEHVW